MWRRKNKRWLWTVMCRGPARLWPSPTATTVRPPAGHFGSGWPEAYRKCRSFSDFWKTSAAVLPEKTHRSVGKETGQTAHMERWNNTLRQRIGRFVRETLSFSKKNWWHDQVTHWFIVEYNLSCSW